MQTMLVRETEKKNIIHMRVLGRLLGDDDFVDGCNVFIGSSALPHSTREGGFGTSVLYTLCGV